MFYDLKNVRKFSDDSVVLKLLRRGDILYFLHKEFVENDVQMLSESELAKHWEGFQQHYFPDRSVQEGQRAVDSWVDNHWVYRFRDNEMGGIAMCRLLPDTQRAFQLYEELDTSNDINTAVPVDSYFGQIVSCLRDIENMNSNDIDRQIASLDASIEEYTKKIADIEEKKDILLKGGTLHVDEREMVNKFAMLMKFLKALPTDCLQISENIRNLRAELYHRIYNDELSQGKALDEWTQGDKRIRESLQGRTFLRFFEYVSGGEQCRWMLETLNRCPRYEYIGKIAEREKPGDILRNVFNLTTKAHEEKNRIYSMYQDNLHSSNFESNKTMRKLLKGLLCKIRKNKEEGTGNTGKLIVFNDMKLPYLPGIVSESALDDNNVSHIEVTEHQDIFIKPLELDVSVDYGVLHQNIRTMLGDGNRIRYSDVLKKYPIFKEQGVETLLAYLTLAEYKVDRADGHITVTIENSIHGVKEEFILDDVEFTRRDEDAG